MYKVFNAIILKSKSEIRVIEFISKHKDKEIKTYFNIGNYEQRFTADAIELRDEVGTVDNKEELEAIVKGSENG